MYEYRNNAYNSQPASVENITHRHPNHDTKPPGDQTKTVGIGYYGVRKNTQSSGDSGIRSVASPISPADSQTLNSLGSPMDNRSRFHSTFNDKNMQEYSDTWNYLEADLDLSPRPVQRSNGRESADDGNHSVKSPVRPLSEGSIFDVYRRNRFTPGGSTVQNRSTPSVRNDFDRSTVSTDPSDANNSGSTFRQEHTLSHSAPAMDTAKPSVMSLREKWEMGRRDKEDSRYNLTQPPKISGRNQNIIAPYQHKEAATKHPENESVRSPNQASYYSRQSEGDTYSRSVFSDNVDRSAQSTMERDHMSYSTGSLRRDPLTHRKIPNGVAKPVREGSLNASRRSLNWSRLSLKSQSGRVTLYGKGYGVHNSLVNMALAALLSLIMCILSIQLLFRVSSSQSPGLSTLDSVLRTNVSYLSVSEVVVALSCIAVMLDLCCLLTCSMQGYFAAKLIKCPQGEERAFRYLKECTPTRFISIIGFFISIPVFFFALMLYIIMEYRSTPAIIAVVVLTIGVSFLISMTTHSTYMWLAEKSSANAASGATEPNNNRKKTKVINGELTNQNELSTLV